MNRSIAIMLFATVCAAGAQATDYYVSSVRAGRSDSNAGTSQTAPWATFDKVRSVWGSLKAGDTVHLERGSAWDYSLSGDWRVPVGGSSLAPITLRGDDYGTGALPVLRRSSGGANVVAFWCRDVSYVTLRDFVLDGGSLQGMNTTAVLIGGSGQQANVGNVNVLNLVCRNLASSSAYYVSGLFVSANGGHTVSDCLIAGNSVSGYNGHGLNHYSDKTTTPNNSLLNRIVWRGNHVFAANQAHYGAIGSGAHIAFGGSGNVFEYNLIEGWQYIASVFLMNCANNESGLVIRYNVIRDNPNNDLIAFTYDGAGCTATLGASVYGNVLANSSKAAIQIGPAGHYSGSVNVFNNTIIGCTGRGAQIAGTGLNLTVRNNIFYGGKGIGVSCTHDHNLFWPASGNTADSGGMIADPLFVDGTVPTSDGATTGALPAGLALRVGSPAIGTGVALAASYAGSINLATRTSGAWDIGAYQSGGSVAPPPAPTPTVPAAPSALTATLATSTSVALAWTDNATNETAYLVERNSVQIASLAANAASYTDTGLSAGTYTYRVRASNGTGNSGYSNTAQVTVPSSTTLPPPASPSNPVFQATGPIVFTNANNYAAVPMTGIGPAAGSVALFANPTSFGSPSFLFGHTDASGWGNRIQLYTDAGGMLWLGLGTAHAVTNLGVLATGVVSHVALTWSGTQYVGYLNGRAVAAGTFSGLTAISPAADVGNDGLSTSRSEGFFGEITDVALYDRAITAQEVLALSQAGTTLQQTIPDAIAKVAADVANGVYGTGNNVNVTAVKAALNAAF